jgi:hypothetical protein
LRIVERGEKKREEEVVIEPVVSSMELHGPIRRQKEGHVSAIYSQVKHIMYIGINRRS